MHERDVIIAADDVAQRRQALLDTLYLDRVRERVAQVLQLLVRRRRGDEQAFAVAIYPFYLALEPSPEWDYK